MKVKNLILQEPEWNRSLNNHWKGTWKDLEVDSSIVPWCDISYNPYAEKGIDIQTRYFYSWRYYEGNSVEAEGLATTFEDAKESLMEVVSDMYRNLLDYRLALVKEVGVE